MNRIILIFSIVFSIAAYAQEKPKILYVPFQETGFITAFDLDELVFANEFGMNNQTKAINDSIFYFLRSKTKHIDYYLINEVEYNALYFAIQPVYKSNPVPHYGIDFPSINQTGLYKTLIETYDVDYVLFVAKYHIAKKVLLASQSFNGSYAIPWSNHFIDYELYDREGNLIALTSKLDLNPNDPKQETFELKGLSIKEMDKGYRTLHRDIWNRIRLYKKKKKTIHKLRKKDFLTPR